MDFSEDYSEFLKIENKGDAEQNSHRLPHQNI